MAFLGSVIDGIFLFAAANGPPSLLFNWYQGLLPRG